MAERSAAKKPAENAGRKSERRLRSVAALAGYLADPGARDFDRLVYERVRLGILSSLAVSPSMTFSELKRLLQTSDGNLSVHARKLEDAGYVVCTKSFEDRHPKTEYRLSAKGRRALEKYLDHMEALIDATRSK